jgi:transposase, IS5 family
MDNLSDERAEFLINDRMSFMRFLGPSAAIAFRLSRSIGLNGLNWARVIVSPA